MTPVSASHNFTPDSLLDKPKSSPGDVVSSLSQSDLELVEAAKRDPENFGILMDRYELPLTRYLIRLTGWAEPEVKDILQETYIKAYRYLNDFDTDLKFSSWLYRIAHNQTIDAMRHHTNRPSAGVLPIEDVARFVAAEADPVQELVSEEELQKVRRSILELPQQYREVLILRFLEEKDYDEIVDILKKPKGTVATLIRRGRVLLEKALKD